MTKRVIDGVFKFLFLNFEATQELYFMFKNVIRNKKKWQQIRSFIELYPWTRLFKF